MTNLVPHDIEEWMRTQERRYADLAARRTVVTATNVSTPRWRSRLASDASVAHSTITNVAYSTVGASPEHNPGNPAFASFTTVLGEPRIVFATAGLYFIRAGVQWNGNGTGSRKILLYRNTTAEPFASVEYPNAGASFGIHQEVVSVFPFNVNDYLKVAFIQYSGGNLTALAAGSGDRAASLLTIVPMGAYNI